MKYRNTESESQEEQVYSWKIIPKGNPRQRDRIASDIPHLAYLKMIRVPQTGR
jgi:hypothetical protein